jgi:hypothetical protein
MARTCCLVAAAPDARSWLRDAVFLNSRPIIKYTIGKTTRGNDAKWQSAQDHLATLSTNSVHRVAEATTHESLIDDEANSAAASATIHDVVTSVRTSQPLASR